MTKKSLPAGCLKPKAQRKRVRQKQQKGLNDACDHNSIKSANKIIVFHNLTSVGGFGGIHYMLYSRWRTTRTARRQDIKMLVIHRRFTQFYFIHYPGVIFALRLYADVVTLV